MCITKSFLLDKIIAFSLRYRRLANTWSNDGLTPSDYAQAAATRSRGVCELATRFASRLASWDTTANTSTTSIKCITPLRATSSVPTNWSRFTSGRRGAAQRRWLRRSSTISPASGWPESSASPCAGRPRHRARGTRHSRQRDRAGHHPDRACACRRARRRGVPPAHTVSHRSTPLRRAGRGRGRGHVSAKRRCFLT